MRIGLIRVRQSSFGGAETFLERFVAELIRRGHTVEVFSTSWRESEGVKVHTVSAPGPRSVRQKLFAANARKAVEEAAPDVVISFERTSCQDIYRAGDGVHAEWLARRARLLSPSGRLFQSLSPFHRTMLRLEKRMFTSPRLKRVVANSKMVKADITRHYGLPEEKLCVIYNGIEPPWGTDPEGAGLEKARSSARREFGIADDELVLLFVGSGYERKGLRYLMRAFAELAGAKGPGLRLLVIGKDVQKPYVREAERLGIAEKVVFAGPVKGALRYYPAGDVFVLPTVYEPFSNACLEAMSAMLPVVTTTSNGASEIIDEGVDGSVVDDPTDHAALARMIKPFLDPEKRRAAGAEARKKSLYYTMERNVTEFLKLIEACPRG